MDNSTKIILDLCGGTGSWSKPYKDAGYDVRVVTIPENDVRTYKLPDEPIYGILAAPPCTMFSLARTRAKKPRDFNEGMETVVACLNLIWEARKRNKLVFWALENPRGYLRQFLGKAPFIFDPWEFGDPYSKKTEIWGYFNFPHKKYKDPKEIMSEEQIRLCSTNSRKLPFRSFEKWGSHLNHQKQSELRSITPKGFADAFFKANQ